MGTFRVPIEIGDPEGRRYERLKRLKDPGATHALLPREILDRLRVRSQRERRFILADQREAIHQTAWVMANIDGEAQRIIVVSGEPGRDAQLGAVTFGGIRPGGRSGAPPTRPGARPPQVVSLQHTVLYGNSGARA